MKKLFPLILSILIFVCSSLHAQEKLTLYYDKSGKGLDTKKKADFYRVVMYDASNKPTGIVEDFFPNGKIQVRSEALYIDKLNNNNCRWKGHFLQYNENGTIAKDYNFDDQGRFDGIETEFNSGGVKQTEVEYSHGNPTKDYYLVYDKKGNVIKYSFLDHQPMRLSTSDKVIVPRSSLKTIFQQGQAVQYYFQDGISVAVKASREKLYGDYCEIFITIENGTGQQFNFDPAEITAVYGNDEKTEDADVLTYDYYIKKVNRRQNWSAAFNAFAEASQASQAGYSASTTTGVATNGTQTVVGQSTTQSYNGANQYAANQIANNNINNYNNQQYSIKQSIAQGYLKLNTIMPNSRLIGFVNVKYQSAKYILINVPVDGKVYQFSYTIKK